MLFWPIRFKGFRLPGLAPLANVLPRRVQQIPGVMQGGVGWQGIIPSRAAKMGSIAVDKGIAKLGSTSEFYKDRKSTRLNSSHANISYAVFCLKKKKKNITQLHINLTL